ncbi:MAG: hypothetical protein ACOC9Y_10125, partial [Chloroflexota bacterium]
DEGFHNHHLFLNWSGRSFSVAFDHQNLMPFEDHERIESVTYHLDAFEGGWADAMTPYRDWYRREFGREMRQRAGVAWADRVRVIIDSFSRGDAEVYERVAEILAPGTVMFHDWNARVTAECYAPNGASRILDGDGQIEQIVNNYARIS